MGRPDQEAIDTFMSITGVSEPVAIQKLEEHAGNLNEAIDAHFSEGDRNITHETSVPVPQDDLMDIDDPIQVESHRPPFSLFPSARNMNPFSLFDPCLIRSIFDSGTDLTSAEPFVSHPRKVREIPIEVKDGNEQSGHSGLAPTIQDVTGTAHELGPEIEGIVTIDEEDDEDIPTAQVAPWNERNDNILGDYSHVTHSRPSAPGLDDLSNYGNDIEEEMIRAAIEASKRDAEINYLDQNDPMPQQRQSHLEDEELAHAVSLSMKTAEQEKAVCELEDKVGPSESEGSRSAEVQDLGKLASSDGRLEVVGSSAQNVTEDVENQPPWGGISSLEHDEAVMFEAALFGGVRETSAYHAPHQFMQNDLDGIMGPHPRGMRHPPSPSLTAQRKIREQQDDEYLASLQADREKELKAREEAETRRLEEQAARKAALEEERQKEEEARGKFAEE